MNKNKLSKKGNDLVVMENANVPEVLTLLKNKIDSLKHITDSVYKTTGNLEEFGDIKVESKIENLIRAYSSVKGREKAYHDAAADLGRKQYPAFNISGGNAEQWKEDILLRINIIEHKETLDKLKSYEERFAKFLSEADQKNMLMKEMEEFLNK